MADKRSLLKIWIKPAMGEPMVPVDNADVIADTGLAGNADQGGKRQITILAAERWADTEAELGHPVEPAIRRANLFINGIELADSAGRVLCVGDARIEIRGQTHPCHLMEAAVDGLRRALEPDWRGGAYGVVLSDAQISIGDAVCWE
ncbi:MAG: MOSC domain-containing protein [Actinobacteria bacterium]|nr:MOSC domain-containing protein [Actinomycetota bacterium]